MSSIKTKHLFFFGVIATFFLFLLIDFLVGGYLLHCSQRTHLFFSRCPQGLVRVSDSVYHHGLSKNFSGNDFWGPLKYQLCTDVNGFKTSCSNPDKSIKNFDIAFIGDSFTEGIGLNYEDTFVGQIAGRLPNLKIANLGVSSYSPSIYFAKVKHLLEQGVTFKELVVYIDISDIQDEAISYSLIDGVVLDKESHSNDAQEINLFKRIFRWSFPLTYTSLHIFKERFIVKEIGATSASYLSSQYTRSAWTYNPHSKGYGVGVKSGIESSLKVMEDLNALLKGKNIKLSIGVYPWPAQLLYDKEESDQVRIWRNFCEGRCVSFFNSFESFFKLKEQFSAEEVIKSYFISGDIHHNNLGAKIIAEDFLRSRGK